MTWKLSSCDAIPCRGRSTRYSDASAGPCWLPSGPSGGKCRPAAWSPGPATRPELADLAALALKRCYEQLDVGGAISLADAVAAVRVAWPVEHDKAIPARDKVLAGLTEAQAAVLSLKLAIIRRFGQDEWQAQEGEVRKEQEWARGSGKRSSLS